MAVRWNGEPSTTKPRQLKSVNALVTAKLPAATTAWFVNVFSGNLTVNSDFTEVAKKPEEARKVEE